MTSNAGAQRILSPKTLGFSSAEDKEQNYKKMKEGVMDEVKHIFKPEFINRIDEIIVFHPLTKEDVKKIVSIMIQNMNKRTKEQMDITIKASSNVLEFLAESNYDSAYGARPLRRAIQNKVEDKLAEAVLEGKVKSGNTVTMRMREKEIKFSIK